MAVEYKRQQQLHGDLVDFDPNKMLKGEWAVCNGTNRRDQRIYICIEPGIVKEMGTYEDFEDMIAEATDAIKEQYLAIFNEIQKEIEADKDVVDTEYAYVVEFKQQLDGTYIPTVEKCVLDSQAAATAAQNSMTAAASSASAAALSQESALESENNANDSAVAAAESAAAAKVSEDNAKKSETAAAGSASTASTKATEASSSASTATSKATEAATSATNAASSARSASDSADTASDKATEATSAASTATTKATEAASSATSAASSASTASSRATAAATSATNASNSATTASEKATAAANSATSAATSASTATSRATAAANSATSAAASATTATTKASEASTSQTNAADAEQKAKEYAEAAKAAADGIAGALKPMGTITFANLPTTNLASGDMYNISNAFTSDSRFKDGGSILYPAGTNVYRTTDSKWDCLAGDMSGYVMEVDFDDTLEESLPAYTEATTLAEPISGEKFSTFMGKVKRAIKSLIATNADLTEFKTETNSALSNLNHATYQMLVRDVELNFGSDIELKVAITNSPKIVFINVIGANCNAAFMFFASASNDGSSGNPLYQIAKTSYWNGYYINATASGSIIKIQNASDINCTVRASIVSFPYF